MVIAISSVGESSKTMLAGLRLSKHYCARPAPTAPCAITTQRRVMIALPNTKRNAALGKSGRTHKQGGCRATWLSGAALNHRSEHARSPSGIMMFPSEGTLAPTKFLFISAIYVHCFGENRQILVTLGGFSLIHSSLSS